MSLDLFKRLLPHRSVETAFGNCDVIISLDQEGRSVRLMRMGESLQSATYLDKRWNIPPFEYIKAFDHMFEASSPSGLPIKKVLMIGGGGFSYPKHLLTTHEDVRIDVIEIDPLIVDIARESFFLDKLERLLAEEGREDQLRIIIQDGIDFLASTDETYDVIINDSFEGACATADFLTLSGIDLIASRLENGGLYMTNVVVDFTREGASGLHSFMTALDARFEHVTIIDASDESFGGADNYLVVASDGDYPLTNTVPWEL